MNKLKDFIEVLNLPTELKKTELKEQIKREGAVKREKASKGRGCT